LGKGLARVLRSKKAVAIAVSAVTLLGSAAAEAGLIGGFEGTSLLQTVALGNAFRPPDTMGAVGTTQFLESNNGSYAVYDRSTGAVLQRISYQQFWSNASGGAITDSGGDQRILFNQFNNRWITIGLGADFSSIQIAVSDTANAMGTWHSTSFVGYNPPPFSGIADYPTLGMDRNGVYIATDNFQCGNAACTSTPFRGTTLNVIPTADLFGGAPTTANMTSFVTLFPNPADRGYAIQGVVNWDPNNNSNVGQFLAADVFLEDVRHYTVNGVNAAGATQTPSILLSTGGLDTNFGEPLPGRQPDGTRVVDMPQGSGITANAYEANGRLYFVQTVLPNGSNDDVVRWTVVDALTGMVIEQGDIGQAGCDFYMGSIAVNEFGEALVAYNRSCAPGVLPGDEGNISFLGRIFVTDGGGGLDQLGAEMLFRTSPIDDYHCSTRINPVDCPQRWGDYAAVSVDPNDHHHFFAIGEYSSGWAVLPGFTTTERSIWNTYIVAVSVPEPSTYAMIGIALLAMFGVRRKMAG
jgi:hypothetical protein